MKKTPDKKAGPRIPFRGYWEILSTYLRRRRLSFVLLAFLICGGIGLQLVNPQILRRVIDGALAGSVGTGLILDAVLFIVVAMIQQACGVLAAYVGYSRVETRRHYTSDVLAGAVIGIAANLAFTRHREHIALSPDLGRGRAGVRLTIVW